MDKIFGKRLKSLRLEKDLKQSELAKIIEVSTSTIGMYEQGRRYTDLETLKKIAEFFDISVDYLIGRTDIKRFNAPSDKLNNILELLNELDESKIEKIETIIKNILTLQEK